MGIPDLFEHVRSARRPVAVADAVAISGISRRALLARAERERWLRPYPEVLAPPGLPVDARTRASAAALHARGQTGDASRDLAAVTRWTAAHLHGVVRSAPSTVEVVIPACRDVADRAGLHVVRSRLLLPSEVTTLDGVPIVTGAALVRDLAAVTDPRRLLRLAIDLQHARALHLDQLRALLERCPRFPGRAAVREIVAVLGSVGRVDSPLELEARERFLADGIFLDRGQVPVALTGGGVLHLDLGIAAIRFGVEVDGAGHHSDRTALTRDANRANEIARIEDDWRVMHLTWDVLHGGWERFASQAREVIGAQSRRHLGIPWPRPQDLRT